MKPIFVSPENLAKARFTAKVKLKNNISLVSGLKANHDAEVSAINYMQKGHKLSTSTGMLLDAWGEKYGIPRGDLDDDDYRAKMQESAGGVSISQQSRPAIGAYISQAYGVNWLVIGLVGVASGAVGAAFNRVPLGRMVYVQCGGSAPNIQLTETLVSATFSGNAYSAATPPNSTLTDNAAMMPGNIFASVWGGLDYIRTQRAIRVSSGITVRVKSGLSVLTRQVTNEIISQDAIAPKNTLATHRAIEVING